MVNGKQKILKNIHLLPFLGVVLISILCLANIPQLKNIQVINDEFGYWGITALFLENDWSGLMQSAPYYSYGYSILMAILVKMCQSPVSMYSIAILLNAFLVVLSYLIAIRCWKLQFPATNQIVASIIPLAIVLYSNTYAQTQIAWSETLLYFLFWLNYYLVLKCSTIKESGRSFIYIICLILSSVFMYTVHQRSLGVLVAVGVFIVYKVSKLFCEDKKTLIFAIFLLGITIGVFFVLEIIKGNLKDILWLNGEFSEKNDYSTMIAMAGNLVTWDGILRLINSIFGKIYYVLNSTLFIGGFGVVFIFKETWRFLKNKCSEERVIFAYAFFSIGLTFGIDAYTMVGNYRLDVPVYGRYFELAIGPLLLLGAGYILYERSNIKQEFILLLVLGLVGMFSVNGMYATATTREYNGYCAIGLYKFFCSGFDLNSIAFEIMGICILLTLIYLFIIMRSKNSNLGIIAAFAIVCSFWFSQSNEMISNIILKWQSRIETNIGTISQLISEENDVKKIYIIQPDEEVYGDDYFFKQMQFALFDKEIHRIYLEDILDDNYELEALYLLPKGSELYAKISDTFEIICEEGYLTLLKVK